MDITLDKSLFNDTLGLSCIENYVLGILKGYGNDITRLYCKSIVSFEQLHDAVFNKGITYENYKEIPRIHSIAKKLELIKLETIDNNHVSELLKLLGNMQPNEYIMIAVKPEFVEKKLKAKKWRDDHYILIFFQDNNIHFINDNPLIKGTLSVEELNEAYDGRYIKLKVLRQMKKRDIDLCMSDFIEAFYYSLSFHKYSNLFNFDDNDTVKTKHLLLIYKVILSRVIKFVKPYLNLDDLQQYILQINKHLAVAEYSILRKSSNICGNTDAVLYVCNLNGIMSNLIYKNFKI